MPCEICGKHMHWGWWEFLWHVTRLAGASGTRIKMLPLPKEY